MLYIYIDIRYWNERATKCLLVKFYRICFKYVIITFEKIVYAAKWNWMVNIMYTGVYLFEVQRKCLIEIIPIFVQLVSTLICLNCLRINGTGWIWKFIFLHLNKMLFNYTHYLLIPFYPFVFKSSNIRDPVLIQIEGEGNKCFKISLQHIDFPLLKRLTKKRRPHKMGGGLLGEKAEDAGQLDVKDA